MADDQLRAEVEKLRSRVHRVVGDHMAANAAITAAIRAHPNPAVLEKEMHEVVEHYQAQMLGVPLADTTVEQYEIAGSNYKQLATAAKINAKGQMHEAQLASLNQEVVDLRKGMLALEKGVSHLFGDLFALELALMVSVKTHPDREQIRADIVDSFAKADAVLTVKAPSDALLHAFQEKAEQITAGLPRGPSQAPP